jgi:hypothetical protein
LKGWFAVNNLSEDMVCQLAMSPFYVLYLVASEHVAPEQISEGHIVRSMEYGLQWQKPISEGIFELLRSNLHKFYANFPRDFSEQGRERWRAELLSVKELLDNVSGSAAMIEDFKEALAGFAEFVAAGGAFRQKLLDSPIRRQAEWIKDLFA